MATEVVEHDVHKDQEDAWSGGKSPFHASYGKLMMWYFLLSDAFTFAGFLIAYGALRFSSPTWPVPDFVFATAPLDIHNWGIFGGQAPLIFVTFMSFLLIISSVTMVRGVQEGHRENKRGVAKWMLLTIIGGIGFLSCQAWEWQNLIGTEGMTITTNPFSTHLENGEYLSGKDLVAAGFTHVAGHGHGDAAHSHGDDHGDGGVHHAQDLGYYLPAGAADTPANRYFVKQDHHGHQYAGDAEKGGIEAGKSYLITYNHDTHHYETSAYKTEGGEILKESFGPKAFGALFFFITGFHGFHVFSGVLFLIIIMVNVMSGLYAERKNGYEMVEKIGLYWHFVDLVWVFVFLAFYLL